MWNGISEAVSALTPFEQERERRPLDARDQAAFLSAFPVIGLAFGLLGLLIVETIGGALPVLSAWLVPSVWLLFSGARHAADAARFSEAVLRPGAADDRVAVLRRGGGLPLAGVAAAASIYVGKVVVLMQAQLLDVHSIAVVVLLVPLFARYVAALLAISGNQPIPPCSAELHDRRLQVVIGSSLFVLLGLARYTALSLALLVAVMAAGAVFKLIAERRLGDVHAASVSALIDVAELIALLVVVLFAGAGINLVYY